MKALLILIALLAQRPEGAMGTTVPPIVPMTGTSCAIEADVCAASGLITRSEHEEGIYAHGQDLSLLPRPQTAMDRWLDQRRGWTVRVVLIAVEERK